MSAAMSDDSDGPDERLDADLDEQAGRLTYPPAVASAIALVRAGYHVAPVTVRPNPLTGRKMPHYHGKWATISTDDPEQVIDWWQDYGSSIGFAIDCSRSGIVVVDLDVKPEHGIDAVTTWETRGMPSSPMVVATPTGGLHLYYRQRDGEHVVNSQGKIDLGIDVRGDGGHVFAPGTFVVGAEDAPWVLQTDLVRADALDVLPDAVYAAIPSSTRERRRERDTGQAQGSTHGRAWIERLLVQQRRLVAEHDARPGSGFRPILRGASMVHGRAVAAGLIERADAERLLGEATAAAWSAPIDDDDATWIDTGIDDGIADPWTVVEEDERDELVGSLDDRGKTRESDGTREIDAPSSWEPIDLAGIFDGTRERTLATVYTRKDGRGAFYPGLTHSLHGESESGKSWVAQHAVVGMLRNGGRALIVDFESSADQVVPRLRALGMAREDVERLVYVNPDGPLDRAFRRLLGQRFDIAIVDGVTAAISALGGVSNSQDDVTAWHRDLPERIARRTGAAVVQIDHVIKAQDGRGRFAIGSQAKMATLTGSGFYVDLGGQLAPGRIGEIRLSVGKDRPGDVRAHAGERRPDRLQPWGTIKFDATKPDDLVLTLSAWAPGAAEDDGPEGTEFAQNTVAPWESVVIPDETPARLQGTGKRWASDLLRILYSAHTDQGLTEPRVQSLFTEARGKAITNPRARFVEAWACLLGHGRGTPLIENAALGGGTRWTLTPEVLAEIGKVNGEP